MALTVTIIGAGPGGYVAALRAARDGAAVTLVEEREVGGTCLNRGCIPTKTLIASAETYLRVRDAEDFGVVLPGPVAYNLDKIRERKDKIVSTQVKGVRELLKNAGVAFLEGRASILSEDVVRAVRHDGTTHDLKSERIIIATGSRPSALPGVPFDGETIIAGDDAVRLASIPESVLIVGAGVIGCEFAFIFRSFGAEVTLVEAAPRALLSEDEEIAGLIERELKKAKIKLIVNARIGGIRKNSDGSVQATLSDGKELTAKQVLVSVGRRMNSENIGLEDAGVKTGPKGEIIVNDRMETNVPGIFAIGDVTGKSMLAHVASQQGTVAAENALGGNRRMDYAVIPAGIFTMPEIGSVGLREWQAKDQGIAVNVGSFPYRTLGKAHAMGELVGMVKVIADASSDKVLGVHICGAHASDLVHEGALALFLGATASQLGRMIHAHPTLAEAVMEAAEDVHGTAVHVRKKERAGREGAA